MSQKVNDKKVEMKLPEVKDIPEVLEKNQMTINLKPELTREDFGKEMWIDLDDLFLDEDTQRSPMENHVKKIAKNLNNLFLFYFILSIILHRYRLNIVKLLRNLNPM